MFDGLLGSPDSEVETREVLRYILMHYLLEVFHVKPFGTSPHFQCSWSTYSRRFHKQEISMTRLEQDVERLLSSGYHKPLDLKR